MAENDRTRFHGFVSTLTPLRTDIDDERPLEEALVQLATWRAEHDEGAAVAVVLRRGPPGAQQLTVRAAAAPAPALVLGRHTACDVAVDGASLRHVVVRSDPTGRVDAMDLRTTAGIADERGRRVRRMRRNDALHFGAGEAEVFALAAPRDRPFPIRYADQLQAHLAGVLYDDDVVDLDALPQPDDGGDPDAARRGSRERTWIERSRLCDTRGLYSATAGATPYGEGEGVIVIPATTLQVSRGVILGRYDRCDRHTQLQGDPNVSRVHALVVAEGEGATVIDLASTNGTRIVHDDGTTTILGAGARTAPLPLAGRVFLSDTEVRLWIAAR